MYDASVIIDEISFTFKTFSNNIKWSDIGIRSNALAV